ncbi:hypothetical protein HanIR_Chr07g0319181 [Helianthus annuus]|nr:hypothetical protein HanIR_Chr07g0319181 [Helianthus annuus]
MRDLIRVKCGVLNEFQCNEFDVSPDTRYNARTFPLFIKVSKIEGSGASPLPKPPQAASHTAPHRRPPFGRPLLVANSSHKSRIPPYFDQLLFFLNQITYIYNTLYF